MSLSFAILFFALTLVTLGYRAHQRGIAPEASGNSRVSDIDHYGLPIESDTPESSSSDALAPLGFDDAFVFEDLAMDRHSDNDSSAPKNDWITVGQSTRTIELARADDCLVVIWDDFIAPRPTVTVQRNRHTPRIARVFLNGVEVATVLGRRRFKAHDVLLIPQSFAEKSPLSGY